MTDVINLIDVNLIFNNKIRVLGTQEKPLFAVSDIYKILVLSNVTVVLRNILDKLHTSVFR
jgi:hypothetical protein